MGLSAVEIDIEDFVGPSYSEFRVPQGQGNVKVTSRRGRQQLELDEEWTENVPGTQSVWIKTFGCSHNTSDSEYMAGQLEEYGYRLLGEDEKDAADLWLINTCTVKNPSQSAMSSLISAGKKCGKPLVIAGCVPQGDRRLPELEGISIIGVTQIDRVVEVVEETLKGNVTQLLKKKELPSLDLPKVRRNRHIEIIPLSTGCLGACTYCKTKHARGQLGSYALSTLVDRARKAVQDPEVREIWLSSEDTGAYGRDIGSSLPEMLQALISVLPSDNSVMLRVGMTNPPFILEHLEDIAQALNHTSVFSYLHVPVQSGSDAVLKRMNREYTLMDFEKVADTLLELVPGLELATDIICGFPGETEEDWDATMQLVRKYRFSHIHISQFYPRPGTPAARMKKVRTKEVKRRSRQISELVETFTEGPQRLLGTTQRACIVDTATDRHHLEAHTKNYTQVLVDPSEASTGAIVDLEVTAATRWSAAGRVVATHRAGSAPLPPRVPKRAPPASPGARSTSDGGPRGSEQHLEANSCASSASSSGVLLDASELSDTAWGSPGSLGPAREPSCSLGLQAEAQGAEVPDHPLCQNPAGTGTAGEKMEELKTRLIKSAAARQVGMEGAIPDGTKCCIDQGKEEGKMGLSGTDASFLQSCCSQSGEPEGARTEGGDLQVRKGSSLGASAPEPSISAREDLQPACTADGSASAAEQSSATAAVQSASVPVQCSASPAVQSADGLSECSCTAGSGELSLSSPGASRLTAPALFPANQDGRDECERPQTDGRASNTPQIAARRPAAEDSRPPSSATRASRSGDQTGHVHVGALGPEGPGPADRDRLESVGEEQSLRDWLHSSPSEGSVHWEGGAIPAAGSPRLRDRAGGNEEDVDDAIWPCPTGESRRWEKEKRPGTSTHASGVNGCGPEVEKNGTCRFAGETGGSPWVPVEVIADGACSPETGEGRDAQRVMEGGESIKEGGRDCSCLTETGEGAGGGSLWSRGGILAVAAAPKSGRGLEGVHEEGRLSSCGGPVAGGDVVPPECDWERGQRIPQETAGPRGDGERGQRIPPEAAGPKGDWERGQSILRETAGPKCDGDGSKPSQGVVLDLDVRPVSASARDLKQPKAEGARTGCVLEAAAMCRRMTVACLSASAKERVEAALAVAVQVCIILALSLLLWWGLAAAAVDLSLL